MRSKKKGPAGISRPIIPEAQTPKQPVFTKDQAIAIVIGCIFIVLVIKGILYVSGEYASLEKEAILKDPVYINAIVTNRHPYKGKGITVEYVVDGKTYSLRTGVSTEFYNRHPIGDSIGIVYYKPYPSKAILEYDIYISE